MRSSVAGSSLLLLACGVVAAVVAADLCRRLYEGGELITIEDEVPSRTWKPYNPHAVVTPPVPKAAPKSPADLDI